MPNAGGDFARATEANGDEAPANASKPVRFTPEGVLASLGVGCARGGEAKAGVTLPLVLASDPNKGKGDGFLAKIDGPFALANGEADAYARNPLCAWQI